MEHPPGPRPGRPMHQNFSFLAGARDTVPLTVTVVPRIPKSRMAHSLDKGLEFIIWDVIHDLKLCAQDFEKNRGLSLYPAYPVHTVELWARMKSLVSQFSKFHREHRGFIELNAVAVRYRESVEAALRRELDGFYAIYCCVHDYLGWMGALDSYSPRDPRYFTPPSTL
ncbi:hypothetical protein AAE478_004633 [Parahypoxylon ruwenzoriense]